MASNLRIPRVASAVLVLGGACDDDKKKSSTDSVDTSQARQDATIEAFCKLAIECGEPIGLEQCKSDYASYLGEYAAVSEDCLDAVLDYYDCYAALECAQIEDEDEALDLADQCNASSEVSARCNE